MINSSKIQEIVTATGHTFADNASIYAESFPDGAGFLTGSIASLAVIKNHAIHFGSEGLTIINLTVSGNLKKNEAPIFIPASDIQSIRLHGGMLRANLDIATAHGNFRYRVRRWVLAPGWHNKGYKFVKTHYTA
ncbi:hypothetical protein ACFQY8_04890 [Alloscardovia venturai]|uniref:Uncharacterized protein n=1 Tax=Alloscardovia venturai TaxID=1769421 RepID=A0ABW2Y5R9_9BIFI